MDKIYMFTKFYGYHTVGHHSTFHRNVDNVPDLVHEKKSKITLLISEITDSFQQNV